MKNKDARSVRREQFPVRWNSAELDALKRGAAWRKMRPSEYLRWLVLRDTSRTSR